ncbi:ATP-binding cassette sub-family A member 2 [Acropora cervicornis]|uniref:ATP-binding cassette sub-family A member 2 n=1 Tax=Acropora cervicornis TaxID=6130 RepID=A0AAD9QT52_ACRCE|nr:ATP-binding cassette sub-family A member 2 [Acropora cervicornis]
MGFGRQLILLLWKNYTLKKRAPFALLIEVLKPLVLFLILMGIRFRREPDFVAEGVSSTSSAFIRDNSLNAAVFIGAVLNHLADILSSPSLSTAEDLKNLPQDYRDYKRNWTKFLLHAQNVDIRDILFDPLDVQQYLQNLSIPPTVAEELLNTTVNVKELTSYVDAHGRDFLQHNPFAKEPLGGKTDLPPLVPSPATALLGLLLLSALNRNILPPAPSAPSPPAQVPINFTSEQFQKYLLENSSSCNTTQLERILVFKGSYQKKILENLCRLTPEQSQMLAHYIQRHIDQSAVMQKLNVTYEDFIALNKSMTKLRGDITNLTEFVHLAREGMELARLLRLNLSFTEGLQNKSRDERNKIYFHEMWKSVGPIICGPDPEEQPSQNVVNHMYDYDCRTTACKTRAMRLMIYLLLHNPTILYSPNGTAADDIIKKANRTLSDIAEMEHLAQEWLNTSQKIRTVLQRNESQHYLSLILNSEHKCLRLYDDLAFNISGYRPTDALGCDKSNPLIEQLNTIDSVARLWLEVASRLDLNIFRGFKDEKSLLDFALNASNSKAGDSSTVVAGIVFLNIKANASLPPHVKYKIRTHVTYFSPPTDRVRDSYWRPGPQSSQHWYYDMGFTWLQDQIERAIIDIHAGRDVIKPAVYLHEMPYPCYVKDNFMFIIEHMMPLCMTVSWIYTVALAVQAIVYEKEQRLKEVMKMMGLSNAVHWVAWFITSLAVMSITYGKVLYYSDPLVVWVFLMMFAVVTIVFCFLISVFFSKAKLAAACGGIVYFLTYLPYVFISIREGIGSANVSANEKMAASLLSTSAFGLGARYFAIYEEEGVGVQWSNLGKILYCMMMDTVIYGILVWYIEAVHPGSYGLPRPWYFICQPSYWFGHNTQACPKMRRSAFQMLTADELEDAPPGQGLLAYEREPLHLPLGVTIENLKKITSFLGHNGAGKTTTMSILTGLFPPTEGTAYIYGCDIRMDMDKIRRSLGMCPQHNVLVMDVGLPAKRRCAVETLSGGMKRKLSVAMAFAGGARTVILDEPTAGVDPYARRAIWDLLIKYKKGRTILLSTHFMDEADLLGDRIAIVSKGKLRCVGSSLFLKSHFGDGYHLTLVKKHDRTPQGSIVNVHLSAASSNQGLENSEMLPSKNTLHPDDRSSSGDRVKKVINFIRSHVHAAELEQNTQQEMTFVLPDNSVKLGGFETFFTELEQKKNELEIDSFGLTDTALEEVFLKVTDVTSRDDSEIQSSNSENSSNLDEPTSSGASGHHVDEVDVDPVSGAELELTEMSSVRFDAREQLLTPEIQEEAANGQFADQTPSNTAFQGVGTHTLTGFRLKMQQFYALLLKRFHHARRNFKGVISQILLPAIFIAIAMTMALSFPKSPDQPPLELSPSMFPRPNYIPFGNEAKGVNQLASRLDKTLTLPSGVGATCCLRYEGSINVTMNQNMKSRPSKEKLAQMFSQSCSSSIDELSNDYLEPSNMRMSYIFSNSSNVTHAVTHKDTGRGCRCSRNRTAYVCDRGAAGSHPKGLVTITLDKLQNITGRNISKYLLYTTQTFKLHRYGSLSFGEVVGWVPQKLDKVKITSAWYNNKGYHALPTYLNVMNNAILRASLSKEKGNPASYGITVYNHYFNKIDSNQLSAKYMRQGIDLVIAIFVIIAMSFVPASFVVFLVTERASKSKHLQFVSGVDPVIYWLSNYAWDVCNYLIPACACITLLRLWSITPIMYPGAFFFSEASSAYVFMIVVNMFFGVTATVTTFILQLFPDDVVLTKIYHALRIINLGFPNYCLGHGLMDLAYNQYLTEYYTQIGEYDKIRDPFEWQLTTRNLVCMAVEGVLFFLFTILMELRFFIKPRRTQVSKDSIDSEDEDVAAEKERVLSGGARGDLVRIENLTKVYHSGKTGKHLAVDRLCLGVPKGECFGLLGVNGAGKSSTFKMLTGDTSLSAGNAYLNCHSVLSEMQKVHKCIGYCPQFDALIDELTGKEQLTLLYPGRPRSSRRAHNRDGPTCSSLLVESDSGHHQGPSLGHFDITQYGGMRSAVYSLSDYGQWTIQVSGKLSAPEKQVWRRLHYYSPCAGRHTRFGSSVSVLFGKEHHHNMVQYQLPSGAMELSEVFGHIESCYEALRIEDYSVSQTTLDNVFINFARQQTDETDLEERSPKLPRTGSIFGVRRRAERLRAMWSDEVRFSALDEHSEQPGCECDVDEWQVTFSDRFSGNDFTFVRAASFVQGDFDLVYCLSYFLSQNSLNKFLKCKKKKNKTMQYWCFEFGYSLI